MSNTILISSDNESDLKKVAEFAKKLKLKARKMTLEEIEDEGLLRAMEEARESDFITEKEVMDMLNAKLKK